MITILRIYILRIPHVFLRIFCPSRLAVGKRVLLRRFTCIVPEDIGHTYVLECTRMDLRLRCDVYLPAEALDTPRAPGMGSSPEWC